MRFTSLGRSNTLTTWGAISGVMSWRCYMLTFSGGSTIVKAGEGVRGFSEAHQSIRCGGSRTYNVYPVLGQSIRGHL